MTTVTDDELIQAIDGLTGRLSRIRGQACADAVIAAELHDCTAVLQRTAVAEHKAGRGHLGARIRHLATACDSTAALFRQESEL
jgi:hypothetical protein